MVCCHAVFAPRYPPAASASSAATSVCRAMPPVAGASVLAVAERHHMLIVCWREDRYVFSRCPPENPNHETARHYVSPHTRQRPEFAIVAPHILQCWKKKPQVLHVHAALG